MLKLTWIEFFLRVLPELFIMVWGIYVISRKSIDMPKYIFSSVILSILIFFVRWLPIYFGVHILVNIIVTISVMIIVGIPIIKSIYSNLLIYFILSLGEFLNIILLNLLNMDISIVFSNPVTKCLSGIPSLIILLLSIIIFNYLLKTKKECF